ncbi:Gtb1p [Lachancea thermotolerans CBS 6340]|uniref:Glucosidase 2 subunit beta n=1 Tax=Lachancea thermotolerans (strain ATCC 56472 / CBS 6340 / NRRL Y-8284) TaxID=559295 RepID=C5DI65_LACTC|nr:KLTH0E10054p [Lachancea thermotolerans CBS 6340]CAR23476.1 KLTH0E10054p [Lachancea thermotolerans CBS 6340]
MPALAYYAVALCCTFAGARQVNGVPGSLQHLYEPMQTDPTKWACLGDPSIVLNYTQINDDFCDCPDGSDEPGTSACGALSRYYCENKGFAPKFVAGFKVNDGVCDCCDCSDENENIRSALSSDNCSQLRAQFERALKEELNEQELGSQALKMLEREYGIYAEETPLEDKKGALRKAKSETGESKEALEACVNELAQAKETYKDTLQRENPLLLQLEEIDLQYVTSVIHSLFAKAESTSRAREALVKILDDLRNGYNKNLNDEVVNRNVKTYTDYAPTEHEELNSSPSLDRTQREQINAYLNEELPDMFLRGSTHIPPAAIVGKFSMARTLIKVRAKQQKKDKETLEFFTKIMDDVSQNYNVNFQDSSVKASVISYRDFLAKNPHLFEPLDIPSEFTEKMNTLEELLNDVSTKILTPSAQSQGFLGVSFDDLAQKLRSFFGDQTNSLEQLKSAIVSLEQKCSTLRTEYRSQLQNFKLLESQVIENDSSSNSVNSETFKAMDELLSKLSPSCVEQKIDNYIYQICLNQEDGVVFQREDKPAGNSVLIGRFAGFSFDAKSTWDRYMDDLRIKYSESDLVSHLESDLDNFHTEWLVGNLPEKNSGLVVDYKQGDRCWNGPSRSARLYFECSDDFKLKSVQEPTRCHYAFHLSGPLGCSTDFAYAAPDWF